MEALQVALGFGGQSKEMVQHIDIVSVCRAQRKRSALKFSHSCVLLLATATTFLILGLQTLVSENARTDLKSLSRLGLGELSFFTLVNFLPRAPVSLMFQAASRIP